MSDATITVMADELLPSDDNNSTALGVEVVHVEFPEDAAAWVVTDADGDEVERCGDDEAYALTVAAEYNADENNAYGPYQATEVRSGVASWCNGAHVFVNDGDDEISVSISVGDPRGGFFMSVRRIPADCGIEHAGRLVLHVPHVGESLGHLPLSEIRPGTFLVG